VLGEIIGYHSFSTKRHENLERLQALLGVRKLRMVRLVATRWLSRGAAVMRVYEIFAALTTEFQEDERDKTNALAGPLVGLCHTAKFLICLACFHGILQTLCMLSRAFQANHVKFSTVTKDLASTRSALTAQYIEEPFVGGPSYRALKETLNSAMSSAPRPGVLPMQSVPFAHRGVTGLWVSKLDEDWVADGVKMYATAILADLTDRFPDVPLFSALSIFDFTEMPADPLEWSRVKGTYGDAEIQILIDHFGVVKVDPATRKSFPRVVDGVLVKAQWESFKHELYSYKQRGLSLDDGYAESLRSDAMPDAKRLGCIFMILCLSTVWCERGFSLMAQIKTKLRDLMNIETLDALMMIASNSPSFDNDEAIEQLINEAYEYWRSQQKRCLARSHPGVKKPRKNKPPSVPLHDLLEAQAKEARDARTEFDSEPEDDDTPAPPENDGAMEVDGMSQQTTEEIQASHGVYTPSPSWSVCPLPASTSEEWLALIRTMNKRTPFWRNKRLAHIFDDGWDIQRGDSHNVPIVSSLTLQSAPTGLSFRAAPTGLKGGRTGPSRPAASTSLNLPSFPRARTGTLLRVSDPISRIRPAVRQVRFPCARDVRRGAKQHE
jgi:hypothetical protein